MNETNNNSGATERPLPLDRLTMFTFLWACQALIHQEFYAKWLEQSDVFGWVLTGAALAVLIFPRSLSLFVVMLIASIAYNVNKWPFVVNHILMESVINLTILAAVGSTLLLHRKNASQTHIDLRNQIYDRFAPVLMWMLIIMYYFAFVAKLNRDFLDIELSCVAQMYGDLVRRAPFLPTADWAKVGAVWSTLVIEAAIPLLLTFRKTRYAAVVLGMAFHFMLGLVGHRTFSGLAFALYGLFLMPALTQCVGEWLKQATDRYGELRFARIVSTARIAVVLVFAFLIAASWTGNYRSGIGPLKIFRVAWITWITWSFVVAGVYLRVMLRFGSPSNREPSATPKWLWVMLILVILNGLSQYLGLKTETCFTMYSNLRTEGQVNNHFFMPALRLAGFQDDLVVVAETDHPNLAKYVKKDLRITHFELRRILSSTLNNCYVVFRRSGELVRFQRTDGDSTHPELTTPHPVWLAKLLYFRPVPKGEKMPCQH